MNKILTIALIRLVVGSAIAAESYEAKWDSLRKHENPEWVLDAKFGIYAHWGPYSVAGGWRDVGNINWANYYVTIQEGIYNSSSDEARRKAFESRYGSITNGVGYKELCADFKPVKFDPEYWADIIEKSGAKYAGICGIHHDGFAMWDSKLTDLCATKQGPKRDLLGDILAAIRKRGIKTMVSFHHERTWKMYNGLISGLKRSGASGIDLLNPENQNLYWFVGEQDHFEKNRIALTEEVIDKYKPDMLWFDGGAGGAEADDSAKILAHYFNMAQESDQEVDVHNKGNFGNNFGIYSFENGAFRPKFLDWPWEDDTPSAVGWCDWPWWWGLEYKKPRDVVVRLVDLVARNGGLLLSLNPRPDGTLDQGQIDLLLGIGGWLKQNGESVYGTRPWTTYAEGHVECLPLVEIHPVTGAKARASQPDTSKFDETDIRFVTKGNTLYATQLVPPTNGVTVIRSLGQETKVSDANKITTVELLGYGPVKFERKPDRLEITLPEKLPNSWALAFKLSVEGKLVQRPPLPPGTEVPYSKKNRPERSHRMPSMTLPLRSLWEESVHE